MNSRRPLLSSIQVQAAEIAMAADGLSILIAKVDSPDRLQILDALAEIRDRSEEILLLCEPPPENHP